MADPVPTVQRMVAVVVAVADAKPLKYLSPALNGAHSFEHWASAQGYETTLLTDDNQPVTTQRLKDILEPILASSSTDPIERLVLYFAGHGLIQEAGEQLWLVSDWNTSAQCVSVSLLQRRLFTYQIGQISIFSDACRLLPASYKTAELTRDGIIGWGPRPRSTGDPIPPVDTFVAAQDYAAAFAVPGDTPDDDRGIFTGVLMPGLWGAKPEAFSLLQHDRVVSRSLAEYVGTEVRNVSQRYGIQLSPTINPTFPENHDVYYLTGAGLAAPPTFPDWPPPDSVLADGPTNLAAELEESGSRATEERTRSVAIAHRFSRMRRQTLELPSVAQFHAGCGFAVAGASVRAVWAPRNVTVEQGDQPESWKLYSSDGKDLDLPAAVLLEFHDGQFAALCALPDFIGSVVCQRSGVTALVYRNRYAPYDSVAPAADVLTRLKRGSLRATDIADIAVNLRMYKYADPILGVVSAYLYDSVGDVDSIRRMAYFYIAHRQPIPYDIALLAQLQGYDEDGILWTEVPAVAERAPASDKEKQYSWSYESTPAKRGPVGGFWPWLRQGWPLLDDPTDFGSTLIHHAIRDMFGNLHPSRFATVDREGAMRLANAFALVERAASNKPVAARPPQGAPVEPSSEPMHE